MTRGRGLLLTGVTLTVLAWRLPAWQRAGTHHVEAEALLGQPVPLPFFNGSPPHAAAAAAYYVYAESCPYCGMDRIKVRRAVAAASVPPARFTAVHLGAVATQDRYWRETGTPLPDSFTWLNAGQADSLGLAGVPLLVLAHNGRVTAAWQGALVWNEAALEHAIRCRLGQRRYCLALKVGDVVRAFSRKLRAISA